MPNRILKESICTSDNIDTLTWFEEVLFYRLMVNCDDYGRFDGRAAIIKNRLFPLKENLTIKAVSAAINALASAGLVSLYEFEGKPYLYLPTWNEHQNVRAKKSKFPSPEDGVNTSEIICKQMYANVPVIQSNTKSESESSASKTRARFVPPTLDEVKAYVAERKSNVDPQGFIDFYAAKGWLVGKTPMKDWKAACRNAEGWERWNHPAKVKSAPGGSYAPTKGASASDMERMAKYRREMEAKREQQS